MGRIVALLKATTNISKLFHCDVVISVLPDDNAVRDVVFGRADLRFSGLAAGLRPEAIHLSMSAISTTAASHLAPEHRRHGRGYVAARVFGNADVSMPSVSVGRDPMVTAIVRGYSKLDWTALGLIAEEEAGGEAPASRASHDVASNPPQVRTIHNQR
jgi:hypothetical protein